MNIITQNAATSSPRSPRDESSHVESSHVLPGDDLQHGPVTQPIGGSVRIDQRGSIHPKIVCLLRPRSEAAEDYLRLRNSVEVMRPTNRGIIVGVTSPGKGDGKTLTAINLAGSLAQNVSARVLLVDLDLRPPGLKVHDFLGLKKQLVKDTAVDGLEVNSDGDQATYHLKKHNLHLALSAVSSESPYELLKSRKLDEFFDLARDKFDYIIVDTPSMLRGPDIELIARVVDGFLVVVKADTTQQSALEEALHLMREDQVLGLVLNSL